MAMEKQYVVRETHTRAITAIGYNPARREILLGCEDGVVKTWEPDAGKLMATYREHKGWVTDFLYHPFRHDLKVMFSSANDGIIIAWSSGGGIADKINMGQPVYCMAINPRRNQLICGINRGIQVYELDEERDCGHYINNRVLYVAEEHTDIVRCIVCYESRVYSGGYDQKLIIYDSSYTGSKSMDPVVINTQAHDAGISTLMLVKDNENNTWIVTGSFDKTVRIWSPDGKLVHKLDGFMSTVTGICYVPRNKTIWAAGGSSYAYLYDPKSGENVSDFIGTFQTQEEEKYTLQQLKFFPELNIVVSSTSRRHLVVWKYNSSGCITALKSKTALESLTYTRKVPILIFSGDSEGVITKWERMQSNHFMYSKEVFLLSDAKKAKKKKKKKDREKEDQEKGLKGEDNLKDINRMNKNVTSHYTYNKAVLPPISVHNHPHTTILKVVFVEELDLILAACEDNNIYVWGFDEDAVKALKTMEPPDEEKDLVKQFEILLNRNSELLQAAKMSEEDSVTNRVAGFMCKHILNEHSSCVTSLAVIGKNHGYEGTYVLSAGWDRRICIWDLQTGVLVDTFKNTSMSVSNELVELACDGIITDLCYCPKRNEFAYSSSDKMVYIRKFSTNGLDMVLLNTLQGHYGEVTVVKWNPLRENWVTGSEDGTIRIWSGEGLNECEQVLSAQGTVACMCIDSVNGAVVAGVQEFIRVYETEEYRLVQTNVGHTDAVRSIIHIPERNQYVSSSWDKTICIWNSWKMTKKQQKSSSKNNEDASDNEEMDNEMPGESGNEMDDDTGNEDTERSEHSNQTGKK